MNRQNGSVKTPIRVAREAASLSREGLADRAGISLRTLERIEAGQVQPRRSTLRVIAGALGLAVEELAA